MREVIVGRGKGDQEKYGMKGLILLGKQFIKMGRTTSLSNKVYLDVNTSHVVFICGKRGGGKCLVGDTKITLQDGSRIPIENIENTDKNILSLNNKYRIEQKEKTKFYTRTVQKTLKITLQTGKKIELTPEHPLLTVKGWKEAQELQAGSRIATPRKISFFGEEPLRSELIDITALIVSEGHLGNRKIVFTNKDSVLKNIFRNAVKDWDPSLHIDKEPPHTLIVRTTKKVSRSITKKRESEQILKSHKETGGNTLIDYFKNVGLCNKKPHEKFIPEDIFTAPKHQLSRFLQLLFSSGGSIYRHGGEWRISYSSSSEKLLDQVQHLLLKFGIISKKRKREHRDTFELVIQDSFLYKYLQEIGVKGKKEDRQKRAFKSIPKQTNTDTVQKEVWEDYEPDNWAEIGRKIGYEDPKSISRNKYSSSRQKLLQIAQTTKSEEIQSLAQNDIYWDEITDIQEINEPKNVYDITVPENHNFLANDIIVHNSYTMGVLAEGVADLDPETRQNISIILLDTMGVYWTMKYPNAEQAEMLEDWGLEPKGLDVQIFTPEKYYHEYKKKGIPTDHPFSVQPSEMSGRDWVESFGLDENSEVGVLIEKIVHDLQEKGDPYSIDEMIEEIDKAEEASRTARASARNRFLNAKGWGLFSKEGTQIKDIARAGQVSVLDVSCYATMSGAWKVKNLVVSLVSDKLFKERMAQRKGEEFASVKRKEDPFAVDDDDEEQDFPLVWLVIDEAHEFLPHPEEGETLATEPLVTILREGRQPGISLVVATQQPGKIHTDVMTQSDTVLSHRITAKRDTKALGMLMQSYMRTGLVEALNNLPRVKGAAIIFDDNNERMVPMRIRPRFTWHGGSAPNALKD